MNVFFEILASLLLLISVYLLSKENIWTWSFGIISTFIFSVIFYNSGLYAQSFLQYIFIVQSIYGWIYWNREKDNLIISNIDVNYFIRDIIITIVFYLIFKSYFNFGTLDILSVVFSLQATYYLIKKYIETWYIWIFVDIISIYLYYDNNLYFTLVLYFILLILAIKGYIEWGKIKNLRMH